MMSIERVENLEHPPVIGKIYSVPCVFDTTSNEYFPVYNYPHADKENGQPEIHYHIDTRFSEKHPFSVRFATSKSNPRHVSYRDLMCVRNIEVGKTPASFIKNSKLPKVCKNADICPHRGYNLKSIVADAEGFKTCPMHGLMVHVNGLVLGVKEQEIKTTFATNKLIYDPDRNQWFDPVINDYV